VIATILWIPFTNTHLQAQEQDAVSSHKESLDHNILTIINKNKDVMQAYLNSFRNIHALDTAHDSLADAYNMAIKKQALFEAMVIKNYLVMLSALETARKGFLNKFRHDAIDRLRVARQSFITLYKSIKDEQYAPGMQQYVIIIQSLGFIIDIAIGLGTEEHSFNRAKNYFKFAQETASSLMNIEL